MEKKFNTDEAKKFLLEKEKKKKTEWEEERKMVLQRTISLVKEELQGLGVEVYLIGSILQPFCFSPRSDIDIVLKNFKGDRFDFWTTMEKKIERTVEVILFEACHFQEFILNKGLKIL